MTEQHPPQPFQPRMVNRRASRKREGWASASKPVPISTRELAELFGRDFTKDADKPVDKPSESDLPVGGFSLKAHEADLVSRHLENVNPGDEADFPAAGKGAKLGRTPSGTPYLTTPASIARATGEEWARTHNVGQRRI